MEKFLLGAEGTVFLFKTDYRRKDRKRYTQSKIGCLFLISLSCSSSSERQEMENSIFGLRACSRVRPAQMARIMVHG